ncbi:sensor histidine kinase [Virgisporangium aurantiacum]|uniref:histidine kinase n=1 Tax=Virgisporangium aurantiacum TaxID=175570 RepID=A0A8J4E0W9_9ACTN|nr:HAMP domain-containing sensor histidine kinase [Virgisporangium aurantiacum]GIJ57384.1 two-component sensor histidine kinase [Virgisporangium aurantiacum]
MTGRRLRTRLALLHAGLAFACGVLLLAFVDLPLIVTGNTTHKPGTGPSTGATTNVAEVLRYSAVALVVIAGVSVGLGWLIAGRAVRPIRLITASARTMSADTLDSRMRVPAAYREFTDLADTLDGLVRRLHESFTAQRQFVANASHELRTPLTVQRTLLQLTLADPDATAGTLRSACEDLLALGERQEHLIDALLTLAAGYRPIDCWEPVDLADVTRNAVLNHHAEAERRGIRVAATLDPVTVPGDARLAASLVTNLVDNALRYNVSGGTVEIATMPPGRLTVSNSGHPIPGSELDRMFQPFQRLGTDRVDRTDGHGLGLAIVAAIAHAHRAPVTAYPRPGGGLHITVDFPSIGPGPA